MIKKMGLCFTALMIFFGIAACAKENEAAPEKKQPRETAVSAYIDKHYLAKDGLIIDYQGVKNPHYLSESVGLYMEYLVLVNDSARFHKLYQALERELAVEDGSKIFIKWEKGANVHVGAFIDDLRIYQALVEASRNFSYPDYADFADRLIAAEKKYGTNRNGPVDFFDFDTKQQAKTLHLSYYKVKAMKQAGFAKTDFDPLKNVPAAPFFAEIYQNKHYETTGTEVNMIDQMLIANQFFLLTGGEKSEIRSVSIRTMGAIGTCLRSV
ncbi:hypothetical protein MFLO_04980 [Listeria floridensis FSL S10-1187]|uniref:Uncharacterized protein n=1 Tax=Listeria floridensis FSL S10-1187 TaxID=1265817 RepID=A0ABN0RGK1_9LIST|nr:hypothetical protein [Listeria floridensis]EUJ32943.1 hypothetical protein MFLO_04980 [Listeria floridensis FSL S10-1187]